MACKVGQACQTVFRESEAQTLPWTPPYTLLSVEAPELLTLACLTWGNGLPAGKHEVEIIERLRQKRSWENLVTTIHSPGKVALKKKVILDIERDDWNYREKEIDDVHKTRLDLAKDVLIKQKVYYQDRMRQRLTNIKDVSNKLTEEKLKQIRRKRDKELRIIDIREERLYLTKYRKPNSIEIVDNKSSYYWASKARRGYNSMNVKVKLCKEARIPISDLSTIVFPYKIDICQAEKKKVTKHDCVNEKYLKMTPEEVDTYSRQYKFFYRIPEGDVSQAQIKPKKVEAEQDFNDTEYLASIYLQKVLKGRAVQTAMQEGRKKNQGLIDELSTTFALVPEDLEKIENERRDTLKSFRKYCFFKKKLDMLISTIANLEGYTINRLVDFISKEVVRLSAEREVLALALYVRKERWRREAWEAGRRQKERRRRRQSEEIFRQLIEKIDEDLEDYMGDILKTAYQSAGILEAEDEIRKRVYNIDRSTEDADRIDLYEQEEMISRLMQQILLPDIVKAEAREKLKRKQLEHRLEAERKLYTTTFKVARPSEEIMEESRTKIKMEEIRALAENLVDTVLKSATELFHTLFPFGIQEEMLVQKGSVCLSDAEEVLAEIQSSYMSVDSAVMPGMRKLIQLSKLLFDSAIDRDTEHTQEDGRESVLSSVGEVSASRPSTKEMAVQSEKAEESGSESQVGYETVCSDDEEEMLKQDGEAFF